MPIDAKLAEACATSLRTAQFFPPVLEGIGDVFESAQQEAKNIHTAWEEIQRVQQLVADILSATASAQLDLDYAWQRAQQFGDESTTTTAFLQQIHSMGEALDAACAAEIDHLCASKSGPIEHRFADMDHLSFAAIHELNTTPELEKIVGEDGMILETADGHLVVAYGDLEHAKHVSTIVAGVGSSNSEDWPTYTERGRRLAAETGAAVVWLGYQAPPNVPAGIATEPALSGATDLREFQAALARRNPEQFRSVIAHSYGTVVAGYAAREGIDADALILAGSPGVGSATVGELKLNSEQPRVIAVTGDRDPIAFAASAHGGIHGPDPTHPQFGAEVWKLDTNHTGYWENPDFLKHMAELPDG